MIHETTRDPEDLPVVLEIYEQGRKARLKGQGVNHCPYTRPRNIRSWVLGWKHQAEGKQISDTLSDLLQGERLMSNANSLIIPKKVYRKLRAVVGWSNWYVNRGRMSHNPTKAERRRVSWRRVH